jgi:hypothetical protein
MSEQGMLFGCIYGGGPIGSPSHMEFYEHNRHVIAALPQKVNWQQEILVVGNMFTVPMPDWDGFYRYQMIHFGASFDHLDSDWETFITQFESLLKDLFWFETYLYMQAELAQSYTEYHWEAEVTPMFETPPRTIQEWEFRGGRREFRD